MTTKPDLDALLRPSYPVLLPCEALAALRQMDSGKWRDNLNIRKELESYRISQNRPSNRDLYTLEVMHSPASPTNYSSNAVALKRIMHREASLPWSVGTDDGILAMWRLLFINKGTGASDRYLRTMISAFNERIPMDADASPVVDSEWDHLMLRYSCLTVRVHSPAAYDSERELKEDFIAWKKATEHLLFQLKTRAEKWASILLWKTTMNFISFVYNSRLGHHPVFDRSFLGNVGCDLDNLIADHDFFMRARNYGDHLKTAPQPFLNQIAVHSYVCPNESHYGELWGDLKKCIEAGLSSTINESEHAICHRYMEQIFKSTDEDEDFIHFHRWFKSSVDPAGVMHWFNNACVQIS